MVMALKDNRTLTKLNLESNQICNGFTEALEKALPHNSSLLELDLSGNQLGDACIDRLMAVQAAWSNSTLCIVCLYGNLFSDEGKNRCLQHSRQGVIIFPTFSL